jgi:predicted nuclease of predicted toxin-antitoxin system
MLRLLIDENIDHDILRGLKSRLPQLDYVLVKQIGMSGFPDSKLLRWAAIENRIIVTHDIKTMIPDAERCVRRGEPMAGIILVPKRMAIGRAIIDLELTVACLSQSEMRNRIEYLPLRGKASDL